MVTNIQALMRALKAQNYSCEICPDTHSYFLLKITPIDNTEYPIVICIPYLPAYLEMEEVETSFGVADLITSVGLNVEWNEHGQVIFQDGRFNPSHRIFTHE